MADALDPMISQLTPRASFRQWPAYIIAICGKSSIITSLCLSPYLHSHIAQSTNLSATKGPPASGKTTLSKRLEPDFHPPGYSYYHFDVYSDEVWNYLYLPPNHTDNAYQFVHKIRLALAELVSHDCNPETHKPVIALEGFPRNPFEASVCGYRLASTTSPYQEFPDTVISLVCPKDEAKARYLARTPEVADSEMLFEAKYMMRDGPVRWLNIIGREAFLFNL